MLEKVIGLLEYSKVLAGIIGAISAIITLLLIFGGGYFFIIIALIDVYEMVQNDAVTFGGILWAALMFGLRGVFTLIGVFFFGFLALFGLSIAFDT